MIRTFLALISFTPVIAFAQGNLGKSIETGTQSVGSIANAISDSIVTSLIVLFISGAVVFFFFGVVKYIWAKRSGDVNGIKNGENFMIWGLIALFVMASTWGIITSIQDGFGIKGKTNFIFQGTTQFSQVKDLNTTSKTAAENRALESYNKCISDQIDRSICNGIYNSEVSKIKESGGSLSRNSNISKLNAPPASIEGVAEMVRDECISQGIEKGSCDASYNQAITKLKGDPTTKTARSMISMFDGGTKDCPEGSSFDEFGTCIPVQSKEEEINEILTSALTRQDAEYRGSQSMDTNSPVVVYEVSGGNLNRIIKNTTGSSDESVARSMWQIFLNSNDQSTVNKIRYYEVYPNFVTIDGQSIYGMVRSTDGGMDFNTFSLGVRQHMINGVLNTPELYHTAIHEGAHLRSITSENIDTNISGQCSNYIRYGICYKRDSIINKFASPFYIRSGDNFIPSSNTDNSFVTPYAKSGGSAEDFAESYVFYVLKPRPAETTIANKKVLFFYNNEESEISYTEGDNTAVDKGSDENKTNSSAGTANNNSGVNTSNGSVTSGNNGTIKVGSNIPIGGIGSIGNIGIGGIKNGNINVSGVITIGKFKTAFNLRLTQDVLRRGKDTDKDGVPDTVEKHRGTDEESKDTDKDGTDDALDVDPNGDGKVDYEELDLDNKEADSSTYEEGDYKTDEYGEPELVKCGVGQINDANGDCVTSSVLDYACPDFITICSPTYESGDDKAGSYDTYKEEYNNSQDTYKDSYESNYGGEYKQDYEYEEPN